MNTSPTPYRPIACSFYDRLQEFATLGTTVEVRYENTSMDRLKVKDIIEDVYTKEKEEFIRLKRGMTIRLDRLISVGSEKRRNDYCGIDPNFNPCGDADDY